MSFENKVGWVGIFLYSLWMLVVVISNWGSIPEPSTIVWGWDTLVSAFVIVAFPFLCGRLVERKTCD